MGDLNFYLPSGYTARKTDVNGSITYVGYARLGEADSGNWNVQKITNTSGDLTIEYGEGAWTDRATLTYR